MTKDEMLKELDRLAEEWCEKYSSPGDFEESGQQEALVYGFNAAMELMERELLCEQCKKNYRRKNEGTMEGRPRI